MSDNYLRTKRTERLEALCGKYIVLADNAKAKDTVLYFQDETLIRPTESKTSCWTRFLVNAKGFDTVEEARACAAKFRYGRPRIAQV